MMPKTETWLLPLCAVACIVSTVYGHGRMILPPSRASAWRLGVPGAPVDYNDNQGFCGGASHQHDKNGGKCGLCGDPYDQAPPRDHERPDGKYVMATDFILSTFREGEIMTASVQLTAAHLGYFEFYLCNVDTLANPVEATLECLHQHKLFNLETNSFQYDRDLSAAKTHEIKLQLPAGLTCNHCVLQWRYRTGNTWKNGCLGCGGQEEFYACSDLRITSGDGSLPTTPSPTAIPTTARPPVNTTPSYIPPQVDPYPLSEEDKEFFLCNYCYREIFENGLTSMAQIPQVCLDAGFPYRMCSRLGKK
ncbi:uncharacterized protein [Littorina saxatilis]|uniref:Chitin-binding type-4 domain-containing protein n=1 Tax=Littorina saxatilis TaxID=31220 RepID=A0AAN9B092_9CAEN